MQNVMGGKKLVTMIPDPLWMFGVESEDYMLFNGIKKR